MSEILNCHIFVSFAVQITKSEHKFKANSSMSCGITRSK